MGKDSGPREGARAAPAPPALLGALVTLVVLVAMPGCALRDIPRPTLPAGLPVDAPLELAATPFFPQQEFHCGPAALATVLGASGVDVEPDTLAPFLYVPDRRGSFQVELAALPRRFDRLAVAVDGTLDAIVGQLALGRPVLVLQNLALERWPRWHYAVVIGYDPVADRFLLRSGARARESVATARFLATWLRAGRWGFVILEPGTRPTGLESDAYLKAAAALESTGRHAAALAAFDAALELWPADRTARLGRANNLYGLGQQEAAMAAYDAVLAVAPGDPIALHNRAMVALESAGPCAALAGLPDARDDEPTLVAAARAAALAHPHAAACATR